MELNFTKSEVPTDFELNVRVSKYEQPIKDFLKSDDAAQSMDCETESAARTIYKGFKGLLSKEGCPYAAQADVKRRGTVVYLVKE